MAKQKKLKRYCDTERIIFMNNQQEQNWHPITMLPMFTKLMDGQEVDDQKQYKTLLEARPKPYVLDDELIQRVISVYSEKKLFLTLHLNQFVKWEKELTLTSSQQTEIERLRKKIIQLQLVVANILVNKGLV